MTIPNFNELDDAIEHKGHYVYQKKKIRDLNLKIQELPWTAKQKEFLELVQDKNNKLILLSGCSGTSKTLISVFCALKALNEAKISDIIYVRSVVESSSNKMGALPGEIYSKFEPYFRPCLDKVEELLCEKDIEKIKKHNLIEAIPINFLRGSHFAGRYVIADECQNMTAKELTTLITRIGENSKMIICGDPMQSDLPIGKSGFQKMFDAFGRANHKNVVNFKFGPEDVVRSKFLKEIMPILESVQ